MHCKLWFILNTITDFSAARANCLVHIQAKRDGTPHEAVKSNEIHVAGPVHEVGMVKSKSIFTTDIIN